MHAARTLLLVLAAAGLIGCVQPAVEVAHDAGQAATDPIEDSQATVARLIAPVLGTVRDAGAVVTEALPAPAPAAHDGVHPAAVALIVRYEVSSPAYYAKRLQGVICPGGASGPTWGIGYDGGHQSAATIRRDWGMRADVERLAATAGQTGPAQCAAARAQLRDVRVPLEQAKGVFAQVMLPTWQRASRRIYPGIELVGWLPDGVMLGNTMNRGTSMRGSRAIEKREIRDTCVPARDRACIARNLRASCRLWRGTELEAGLCGRRFAEADLVES